MIKIKKLIEKIKNGSAFGENFSSANEKKVKIEK
jgi:hypothetical protein